MPDLIPSFMPASQNTCPALPPALYPGHSMTHYLGNVIRPTLSDWGRVVTLAHCLTGGIRSCVQTLAVTEAFSRLSHAFLPTKSVKCVTDMNDDERLRRTQATIQPEVDQRIQAQFQQKIRQGMGPGLARQKVLIDFWRELNPNLSLQQKELLEELFQGFYKDDYSLFFNHFKHTAQDRYSYAASPMGLPIHIFGNALKDFIEIPYTYFQYGYFSKQTLTSTSLVFSGTLMSLSLNRRGTIWRTLAGITIPNHLKPIPIGSDLLGRVFHYRSITHDFCSLEPNEKLKPVLSYLAALESVNKLDYEDLKPMNFEAKAINALRAQAETTPEDQ